ncbi:MAG: Gfo/Idh/MocA family oxidoreductase, partial [Planctomycetes bacterium]|nr:Gfo/Idh/MocA family oxidoreductase [Planctomycetota bacterium]
MSTTKLRIAIVGAGGWGNQHARICASRADVELVGICGRTAARTEERAAAYDTRAYLSISGMLSRERPDLVFLSLPNREHFKPTLEVIEAGFPLFVEKPLVFDLQEADQLLAAAKRKELFFGINFNWRWAKPVQLAKQAIASGRLGDPVFATWRFGGEGGSCALHDNLIETQCHGFDQLEHLCGPIASVSTHVAERTGKGPSTMALAMSFASGAVGSLVGSYDSSYAYAGAHAVEIVGTKGRVLITDTVKRFSFQAAGSETAEVWEAGFFNDVDREFHRTMDKHVDDLLKAFRAGQAPPVPADAGRRALALAKAAIASHASGQR